jgi:hypothetical protein
MKKTKELIYFSNSLNEVITIKRFNTTGQTVEISFDSMSVLEYRHDFDLNILINAYVLDYIGEV